MPLAERPLVGEELWSSVLEAVDEIDDSGLVVVVQFHQVGPSGHGYAAVVLWPQGDDDFRAVAPGQGDQLVDHLSIVGALEADPDSTMLQIVDDEFVREFPVVVAPVCRLREVPARRRRVGVVGWMLLSGKDVFPALFGKVDDVELRLSGHAGGGRCGVRSYGAPHHPRHDAQHQQAGGGEDAHPPAAGAFLPFRLLSLALLSRQAAEFFLPQRSVHGVPRSRYVYHVFRVYHVFQVYCVTFLRGSLGRLGRPGRHGRPGRRRRQWEQSVRNCGSNQRRGKAGAAWNLDLMVVHSVVRSSAYFDSVTLMLVQREVRQLSGVEEAGAVMGTDANKELLRDAGLLTSEAQAARPDDLILAVRAGSDEVASAALRTAETLLVQRRETAATGTYRPKTVASAVRMPAGAHLALISVPGRFAAGVARDALAAGLHVMLFSDNVPLQAEIELKQTATARGLLMMGPDCGTAIIGGTGLGFANRVRRGTIGIVGAAGTGIQEVASLVHRGGAGISHAIGTGGRDVSRAVGGLTALQ